MSKYIEAFSTDESSTYKGNFVFAYVPWYTGRRAVTLCKVIRINKNTIRVEYYCCGSLYKATITPNQWSAVAADVNEGEATVE